MEYMVPFILAFELSLFGDDHSRDCHYKALNKYIILIIFFLFFIYILLKNVLIFWPIAIYQ